MSGVTVPRGISVVIPVKNEAVGLAACLDGILSQTVSVEEILVIDSGSTDGTQDIVRRYRSARLIEIPSSEFNHGDTRNLGVRESHGDYVLFTVGDARPVDEHWVEQLLAGFVADDVVVVSGIQVVPHTPATNPLQWFRPVSSPQRVVYRFGGAAAYDAATGDERRQACVIDDVTAMYRRAVFDTLSFQRVTYGEDMLFAIDALRSGFALVRDPSVRVYHYHDQSYATTFKRSIVVGILRYELFGVLPQRPRPEALRWVARLVRERRVSWPDKLRWWRYNRDFAEAVAEADTIVRSAVAAGPNALLKVKQQYCDSPPTPLKPKLPAQGPYEQ